MTIYELDLKMYLPTKANSAFHPSGVGKWVPALAGRHGSFR